MKGDHLYGAQTRTDVLPYISLIPVFGYLWPGTSTSDGRSPYWQEARAGRAGEAQWVWGGPRAGGWVWGFFCAAGQIGQELGTPAGGPSHWPILTVTVKVKHNGFAQPICLGVPV